jgi:hypothetical protein
MIVKGWLLALGICNAIAVGAACDFTPSDYPDFGKRHVVFTSLFALSAFALAGFCLLGSRSRARRRRVFLVALALQGLLLPLYRGAVSADDWPLGVTASKVGWVLFLGPWTLAVCLLALIAFLWFLWMSLTPSRREALRAGETPDGV